MSHQVTLGSPFPFKPSHVRTSKSDPETPFSLLVSLIKPMWMMGNALETILFLFESHICSEHLECGLFGLCMNEGNC